MATIDLLKTDAPSLEFYTHMNRAFLLLDKNSVCFRGQDYTNIVISCTSYGEDTDGNLDKTKAINTWNESYSRAQLNTRITPDGFLPYNIWVRLENYWYEIQLRFQFDFPREDGGVPYDSKIGVFPFDNRNPTLTGQKSSEFFVSSVRENLQKTNSFTAWFDFTPDTYVLNDILVEKKVTDIMQIK